MPIVSIVPGQLFALYLTVARGLDPERPTLDLEGHRDPLTCADLARVRRRSPCPTHGSRIPAGSPSPMSHEPRPTASAPARMKSGAVSTVTPPVASSGMRKAAERTDEGWAGHRGREELHRRCAGTPGGEDLRRGEGARDERDAAVGGPFDQLGIDMRRDKEGRAGVVGALGRVGRQDRRRRSGARSRRRGGRPSGALRRAIASGSLRVSSKARTPPRSRPSATSRTVSAVSFRAIATTPPSRSPAGIGGRASVTRGRGRGRARRPGPGAWPAKPLAVCEKPQSGTSDRRSAGRARAPGRSARRRRTRSRRTSS